MANSENVIVKAECLWKRFGSLIANECISISAHEGEVVSILGPNGAGKTTLLRQIYGELRPDSGVVTVMGLSPRRLRGGGLWVSYPRRQPHSIY